MKDKVKLKVIAGDGGDGCASGRREKYIAFGGPDGGDGGVGGSVYLVGDEGASSLLKLHYQKQIKAKKGEHGKGSQQYGEDATDVFVPVPLGTMVKDKETGEILGTVLKDGEKLLIAKGGRGGWGNIHFKTNVKQYPNFAMYGEPGEKKELQLELQLIGDVTLIGFPSVGKSSIINTLSNTNVKVADYSFTTIIPNLGVVKHKNQDFVLVDVPGLIEGAGKGRGLGNEFLRHILKSKVWTFIIDVSRYEESLYELTTLKYELEIFLKNKLIVEFPQIIENESLLKISYINFTNSLQIQVYYDKKLLFTKFVVFLINKIDLVADAEILKEFEETLHKHIKEIFQIKKIPKLYFAHAGNQKIFEDYLHTIINLLKEKVNQDTVFDEYLLPKEEVLEKKQQNYIINTSEQEIPYLLKYDYIDEDKAEIVQVFEVFNKKLAYYTYILPWGNKEAEMLFFDVMKTEGITKYLEDNGVMIGDILKIKSPYSGVADRYIEWKL